MTSNLGRTLYTSFREAANPLFARGIRASRFPFSSDLTSTSTIFREFLSKSTARRPSTLPSRKSTQVTKRFASGGFLAVGISPNSTVVENGATCAIAPEKVIYQQNRYLSSRTLHSLSQNSWKRGFHTSNGSPPKVETSKDPSNAKVEIPSRGREQAENITHPQNQKAEKPREPTQWASSNIHLFNRFPNVSQLHRPTKEELLAAATGFWSRFKIRFKWFSIRSVRPFNLDEITALFSWVFLGHVVWVVVGTTTFFSLLILAINTVFAQGKMCYLPNSSVSSVAESFRNPGRVDRKLPYEIIRSEGCF